jgi:hypothetical protein
LAAIVLLLAVGGANFLLAAPQSEASPKPSQDRGEVAKEPMTPDDETVAMRALIERSLTDPEVRGSLELLTECRNETGMRTMRIWSDGLGIWQGTKQIQLESEEVTAVLEHLRKADFAGFAPIYGGRKQEDPREHGRPDDGSAVLIICRVQVSLDGQTQQSAQRAKGEQSEVLRALAEAILALGEGAAKSGLGAESLVDGLERVGRGELDPRVLRAMLHRKPSVHEAAEYGPGSLLRLEGREATTRRHDPGSGYGEEIALELEARVVRNLALVLAGLDPAAMPVNLWAPVYTEVAVEVLDHRISVQARQFAGLEPATHGDLQKDFDAVVQTLFRLQEQVAAEGTIRAGETL